MRIHFGIFHDKVIKWPTRCAWCGAETLYRHNYKKKTIYDFQYKILWFEILSRTKMISYPVCRLHNFLAHLLKPVRLAIVFVIMNLIIFPDFGMKSSVVYLLNALIVVGYIYYRRKAVIIHRVHERYFELSIPDGKYAEEFAMLNECNKLERHILMQD